MKRLIIVFLLFCFQNNVFAATIRINEVMPANGWTINDSYGESSDWFELYNYGNEPVNLGGYRVNDRDNYPDAFILPDTVINPGEYIIIWASGRGESERDILQIEGGGPGMHRNQDFYDEGSFSYVPVEGDFTASIQINNFLAENDNAYLIFMAREEENINSRWTGVGYDKNSVAYRCRVRSKNPIESGMWINFYPIDPIVYRFNFASAYAKIVRNGDNFYNYVSRDGIYWSEIAKDSLPDFADKISLGLLLVSGDHQKIAKSQISKLKINDNLIHYNSFKSVDYFEDIKSTKKIIREIHTDFSLSRKESLFLWNNNGDLKETISWDTAFSDISFTNNNKNLIFYENPTPGYENSEGYTDVSKSPLFSAESGYYYSSFELKLLGDEDIYYSLNGNIPDTNSLKYIHPITISNNTTVRAISAKKNKLISGVETRTYIFEPKPSIPTVFISAPVEQLYSKENGILYQEYDNDGNLTEPNVNRILMANSNIELLKNKNSVFNETAGLRLRGGATRRFPQKSFSLSFKNKYKSNGLQVPIFDNKHSEKYSSLMLRNSGNDWHHGFIRDPFVSVVADKFDFNVDWQAYFACRVYINGEYYGMLNLREKSNEDYIESNYSFDEKDIFICSGKGEPNHNSSYIYREFINEITDLNASDDSLFNSAFNTIDISSFIDYYVLNIFIGNVDWPYKNSKLWSHNNKNYKLRHILYDTDYSLGFEGFSYRYNPYSVLLDIDRMNDPVFSFSILPFIKFVENKAHRNLFLNTFADRLNTSLKPENTLPVLDSLDEIIRSELVTHKSKWSESVNNRHQEMEIIRDFLRNRIDFIYQISSEAFNIPGTQKININIHPPEAALFDVNSLKNLKVEFQGRYFAGVPYQLRVKPLPGWKFVGWGNSNYPDTTFLTIVPDTNDLYLTAHFEKTDIKAAYPVINEIMYRSDSYIDPGDWVELYNPHPFTIDISDLVFKDAQNSHSFIFDLPTYLFPDDYLVVAQDLQAFKKVYPNVYNVVGSFEFGLGTDDKVRLLKETNEPVGFVDYHNRTPWPLGSDGTGYSIELISHHMNNKMGQNWQTSYEYLGTPGRRNSVSRYLQPISDEDVYTYYNEFQNAIICRFNIEGAARIKLEIFDLMGRLKIMENSGLIDNFKEDIYIPAYTLSSGTYFIRISIMDGKGISTKVNRISVLR